MTRSPQVEIKQVETFADPATVATWREGAAARAVYLAAPTAAMFELAAIKPGSRVLVVGGGTGEETIEAARMAGRSGRVTLTDLSAAMVAEAKKAVAAAGLENVGCLVMDAQHLEFPDAAFDAVIARNVLMFVPQLSAGLAEIRRVLRPGGKLAATVWSAGHRNPRMSIPVLAARALGATVPAEATLRVALRLAHPTRLSGALRRAGFSNVSVRRVAATFKFDDSEAFVDQWYKHGATQEVLALIPAGSIDRLRAELERRLRPYARMGILPGEQLVVGGAA